MNLQMLKRIAGACIGIVPLLSAQSVVAKQPAHELSSTSCAHWDALTATTGVGGLSVVRAKACVKRQGKSFDVAVFGRDDPIVQSIQGKIEGKRINARRTVEGSDIVDEPLQGTWARQQVGRYYTQSIVLSNTWTVVILTRSADMRQANPEQPMNRKD